jgi:uncharacterized protein
MHTHPVTRRRALCCGALAATGLFTSLAAAAPPDLDAAARALRDASFDGLEPAALWDVHAHLLGTGDAGSGCRVDARSTQWRHPVERLRRSVILKASGVTEDAPSIDLAYVRRLSQLAEDFPAGARWLLLAFDEALDAGGQSRPDWTTFHVPDRWAATVAAGQPQRFGWVASVHPHRADALARLDAAVAAGALALKWLPSAMAIDLRAPRLASFYDRLAQHRLPLLVHCGAEHAVPGAGLGDLGNPLHVRVPLAAGVRVIVAHCASLGQALDTDARRPSPRPAFELFARLMDEPAWRSQLLGDVSAVFQANRDPGVWRTLLARTDWHPRLLHGSDHPLPGVGWLYRPAGLVRAGLLDERLLAPLDTLRARNPLLFDLALKRALRWRGQGLSASVFDTRRLLARGA